MCIGSSAQGGFGSFHLPSSSPLQRQKRWWFHDYEENPCTICVTTFCSLFSVFHSSLFLSIEVVELLMRNMSELEGEIIVGVALLEEDPEPNFEQEKGERREETTVPSQEPERTCLGELSAVDDEENEGFRTPTSSENKIPPATICPPAPRKPARSIPMKRIPKVRRKVAHENFTYEDLKVLIPNSYIRGHLLSKLGKLSREERK